MQHNPALSTRAADAAVTATPPTVPMTVVGLFEDRIDAEHVLSALRRNIGSSHQVSLILRATDGHANGTDGAEAVARAIVATALETVGSWLQGLASLIVPERGIYLVAGPLGAAMAGISPDDERVADKVSDLPAAPNEAVSLLHTFTEFGFGAEEATYLEHRLAAGAVVVAVTSDDQDIRRATRRLFTDDNAVHIGQAWTDAQLAAEANALLNAPPEAARSSDVIVADAVAALRHICTGDEASGSESAVCGIDVVDPSGGAVGTVSDLLADPMGEANPALRYVVVSFGGVLGLGRHHVAVPAGLIDTQERPARATTDREIIQHGPRYDPSVPFSRRQEAAIAAYFATPAYWEPR